MWVVQRRYELVNHRPYWQEIDGKFFYSILKKMTSFSTGSWADTQQVANWLEKEYDAPHRVIYKDLG
jgi:hypothetical protein